MTYSFQGLDKNDLERKVRLLVLADLGSRNIGRDIPYHEIASALQIDQSQVEACAIDGKSVFFPSNEFI